MIHDRETLTRLSWQTTLFCEAPKRFDLAKLVPNWELTTTRIRVHRNHAFEHVSAIMEKWLNWYFRKTELWISDYDDSLSFGTTETGAFDLDLVWIDLDRYSRDLEHTWLISRLKSLRALSRTPIILATIGGSSEFRNRLTAGVPGIGSVLYHDFEESLSKLGVVEKYSERTAKLTGTRLSEKSMILSARELACRLIPDCLVSRKKAIVVDLDGTLYEGVLGEQGPRGVGLTENHHLFQNTLIDLKKLGFFLALASRNEEEDVRELFRVRDDFPLKWTDFSAHQISWQKKSQSLVAIAEKLRIGVDSLVFVDDNPGELIEIATAIPTVGLIHAQPDASITSRTLEYFPGLWKSSVSREDAIRATDLEANNQREEIRLQASDPKEYLASLGVRLDFYVNDRTQLSRMGELSSKTNQFNLALNRFTDMSFNEMLDSDSVRVVTVGLADKLSDSGLIALCVVRFSEDSIQVEELTISCRALGRGLEDIIIGKAVEFACCDKIADQELEFKYTTGSRNKPALDWLARRANVGLLESGVQRVPSWSDELKDICSAIQLRYQTK
jgi:FkbH-like protein